MSKVAITDRGLKLKDELIDQDEDLIII